MSIELSIIIPIYNAEKYLNRCIDSIINQSYKDFEIILVNDGSTDSSLEICKQYSKKYKNIFYYTLLNSGPSKARNYGLKKAKGEYISFIDADDFIDQDMYLKMIDNAKYYNSDIVICNYKKIYVNNTINCYHGLKNAYFSNEEIINGIIRKFYHKDVTGLPSPCNKLYKKYFLDRCNATFDENLYRAEDWWFNLKLFEKAKIITTLNNCFYNYWQENQNSIMKRLDKNYYSEWKNSREYLMTLKEQYKFEVDYNEWSTELIYNIHALLISLCKKKENIDFIILDKFYDEIIKYDKLVNKKLKIIHKVHNFSLKCEKIIYLILSKIY